jgi:hypothetical protein
MSVKVRIAPNNAATAMTGSVSGIVTSSMRRQPSHHDHGGQRGEPPHVHGDDGGHHQVSIEGPLRDPYTGRFSSKGYPNAAWSSRLINVVRVERCPFVCVALPHLQLCDQRPQMANMLLRVLLEMSGLGCGACRAASFERSLRVGFTGTLPQRRCLR